jgi:cobalamin biosynthesis protein CbiD
VLDALQVALGPGATATAFATALIVWLRNRHGEVRIKVTLPGKRSVELTARRVARLDAAAVEKQVAELTSLLTPEQKDGLERVDGP